MWCLSRRIQGWTGGYSSLSTQGFVCRPQIPAIFVRALRVQGGEQHNQDIISALLYPFPLAQVGAATIVIVALSLDNLRVRSVYIILNDWENCKTFALAPWWFVSGGGTSRENVAPGGWRDRNCSSVPERSIAERMHLGKVKS